MRYKLRLLRLQRELTLKQVASEIGLTKAAYRNIEVGLRDPSWKIARRMEKFFGTPASELLEVIEAKA